MGCLRDECSAVSGSGPWHPNAAAHTEKQSPRDSRATSIIAFFCTLAVLQQQKCAQMWWLHYAFKGIFHYSFIQSPSWQRWGLALYLCSPTSQLCLFLCIQKEEQGHCSVDPFRTVSQYFRGKHESLHQDVVNVGSSACFSCSPSTCPEHWPKHLVRR